MNTASNSCLDEIQAWFTSTCRLHESIAAQLAIELVNVCGVTDIEQFLVLREADPQWLDGLQCKLPSITKLLINSCVDRIGRVPLHTLTADEVAQVVSACFSDCNYSQLFEESQVNGFHLLHAESIETLTELGVYHRAHASVLLASIKEWRRVGVPTSYLNLSDEDEHRRRVSIKQEPVSNANSQKTTASAPTVEAIAVNSGTASGSSESRKRSHTEHESDALPVAAPSKKAPSAVIHAAEERAEGHIHASEPPQTQNVQGAITSPSTQATASHQKFPDGGSIPENAASHPGVDLDAVDLLHEEMRGYESSDSQGRSWQDFGQDQEHDVTQTEMDENLTGSDLPPTQNATDSVSIPHLPDAASILGDEDAPSGPSRPRRLSAQRFPTAEASKARSKRNVVSPSGNTSTQRASKRPWPAEFFTAEEPLPPGLPARLRWSYQVLCANCKQLQSSSDADVLLRVVKHIGLCVLKNSKGGESCSHCCELFEPCRSFSLPLPLRTRFLL
jgi:hypothetical protein